MLFNQTALGKCNKLYNMCERMTFAKMCVYTFMECFINVEFNSTKYVFRVFSINSNLQHKIIDNFFFRPFDASYF